MSVTQCSRSNSRYALGLHFAVATSAIRHTMYKYLLLFLVLTTACTPNSSDAPVRVLAESGLAQLPFEKRGKDITKIIVSGHLSVEIASIKKSREEIIRLVDALGGFIEQESSFRGEDRMQLNMVIRTPVQKFQILQDRLSSAAIHVDDKGINRQDISEEYVDLEQRATNKKALEERYLKLLTQAKTMSDVIAIEQQLNQLRAEIEGYEGGLKQMDDNISYATLHLTIYEKLSLSSRFGVKIKSGWQKGWQNLLQFLLLLIYLWPFVLIVVLTLVFLYLRKRKRQKNASFKL